MLYSVFLILYSVLIPISNGLFLDVNVGQERCIGQELDQEDTATFKFKLTSENSKSILIASISDPDGDVIFSENLSDSLKEYKQNIETRGVYDICFNLAQGKSSTRVFVDIDFKARSDRGKNSRLISKKLAAEYIPTLEDELNAAEEVLANIGREIEFARRQEVILRQVGEHTQSRIQWFSALSILVLVFTSLWQLIYLRKYFVDKKIL